jgi:hypothetical protein
VLKPLREQLRLSPIPELTEPLNAHDSLIPAAQRREQEQGEQEIEDKEKQQWNCHRDKERLAHALPSQQQSEPHPHLTRELLKLRSDIAPLEIEDCYELEACLLEHNGCFGLC